MDPATLATMYAINVGINALGGKRGSNLFKDSFRDTATMALTQQFMPSGASQKGSPMPFDTADMGMTTVTDQALKPKPNFLDKTKAGLETFSDVFRMDAPEGRKIDPFKVGIGAAGAAGLAYGLGAFDPVPPPEPKYPGFNRFYAQNPSQFMPYDDPDIGIDYSNFPDKPYSGLKAGGIMGLEAGGDVGLRAQIDKMKKTPEGLRELSKMIPGAVTEFKTGKDNQSVFTTNPQMIEEYIRRNEIGIKDGGIMNFQEGGMSAPDLLREAYEKYKKEKDDAGEEAMNFEQFKQFRTEFGPMKEGGITKLMAGGRASNMPVESIEEGTQEQMDMIAPPMSSITPRQMFMPMMMAKDGALVDKLPSKTNNDENNISNYKRTSGKLVVDAAGKGNEEKDTMLAQLADGEFVTKSKAVRGAGIALGADPKDKKQQRELGARFFYKQMADFDKLAKRMS
mgnify:CR=1 FL=1